MPPRFSVVDTHAHLCDPVFEQDLEQVLKRAEASGVSCIIAVGETLADAKRNLRMARDHSMIRAAAGLYPAHVDPEEAEAMAVFIRSECRRLAAIGEVGLDHWVIKEESERALQRDSFGVFIDLAHELDLPLNVHSRSAGRHAVSMLLDRGARKVQLHAFDAKVSSAMPAVEAGYFFSIPPSIVRSPQKQKLVKRLPLSSLLVETDSPVLGPLAGERNEPANALISVKAIAEIKGITREEVMEVTYRNFKALYGDLKEGDGEKRP